jgi:hypothetical protein
MLELEVSGVGPVRLPVRAPLAKKLIAVARPAMFGRGERTLTEAMSALSSGNLSLAV